MLNSGTNKITSTSFLLLLSVLLYSCTTDFSTIAPYKETPVVYGLLNPDTAVKTQYIRISKAFLGEGNSLVMAQQKDSINYADILDVTLQRLVNGIVSQSFLLQRADTNVKDEGIFNSPYEVLYKLSPPNKILIDGSSYKLIVHNKQSGLVASAVTKIVGPYSIATTISQNMNFTDPNPTRIEINTASNGWVYNLTLRFHYKDVVLATHDTTSRYVDWNFDDQAIGFTQATKFSYDNIDRTKLYRIVGSEVTPADTNVLRRLISSLPIELITTAGTEDLYTYMQLTGPTYGLVQDRPVFSNIENGVGLFTSRHTTSLFRNMNDASKTAFDTSAYTKNIHFVH
jgi:hypothetical protein